MPLDPAIANMLMHIREEGLPSFADCTAPEQARQMLRTLMVDLRDPATLAEVGSVTSGVVAESIPVRIYRPEATGSCPTVVYFHGGGYVVGDLDTHDGVCRALCRDVTAVVVSVDYRLAPENPFPAAVDDVVAATRGVAERIDDYGGDATRLAVAGDSAGAALAAVSAQQAHADGITVAAQLLIYPPADVLGDHRSHIDNAEGYFLTTADIHWFTQHYVGIPLTDPETETMAADPRLSPLRARALHGLAPAVVVTAEFDPLRDDGNRYAEALQDAGVKVIHREFPGLIHGFYGLETFSPAIAAASTWANATLRDLLR